MRRLVVLSNRLPSESSEDMNDRTRPVGGLASALNAVLGRTPGSLWFGWSGATVPARRAKRLQRRSLGATELIGIPMTAREVEDYYHGFCNRALWPICHGFQGRAKLDEAERESYASVNRRFVGVMMNFLRPGDLVWVHDYHFFLAASEMRRLGWKGRIGFFLHTPFPPRDLWTVLPEPEAYTRALLDYDLVGFHTRSYLDNYVYCAQRVLDAAWDGRVLRAAGRTQTAGVYPIGIDPRPFRPPATEAQAPPRASDLRRVVRGRRLILGVDRLDYTKGIPERILALEELFRRWPQWRRRVSFVQVAAPSRSRVPEYVKQKDAVERMVGRVNGEYAEHDWVPIRYLYRSYGVNTLSEFYRQSDVALVTPLRDGMNLVAKEYVAAQNPDSPGVLVLSRFAGAAEDLEEAIIVNPYVPARTADGIARALAMPIEERRERHAALLRRVLSGTAEEWSRRFVRDLEAGPVSQAAAVARARS